MEENNQEQINVNQNLNEQQRFTPLGQVNEPMPKKKKSKLGVVIVLLGITSRNYRRISLLLFPSLY